MHTRSYYWCEPCSVHTTIPLCKLCGGEPVPVEYVDRFDRIFHLELVLRIHVGSLAPDQLDRILARLTPCPLCDGQGIIEPPERDGWGECPVCWGAMYATRFCRDPFHPQVMPGWYDIAMPTHPVGTTNRLKKWLE